MKKPLFKRVNVTVKGKRTTVSLTAIDHALVWQFAAEKGLGLGEYLSCLIKHIRRNYDKRYSNTLAIREGIIITLLNKVEEYQ